MAKRKRVGVLVTLSVAPGVTVAQARRELRTRVNDLCGHYSEFSTRSIQVLRAGPWPEPARLSAYKPQPEAATLAKTAVTLAAQRNALLKALEDMVYAYEYFCFKNEPDEALRVIAEVKGNL